MKSFFHSPQRERKKTNKAKRMNNVPTRSEHIDLANYDAIYLFFPDTDVTRKFRTNG